MAPDENHPATDSPDLFEVNSRTGRLDISRSSGIEVPTSEITERQESISNLITGPLDDLGSSDSLEPSTTVPTGERTDLDRFVNLGKDLLSAYSDPAHDDHNPQHEPLRYLWNDAPELLLAGAVLGYLGVKAIRGTQSSQPTPQQPSTLPEDRPYRVFVSHSWKHSDHHARIREFLDETDTLDWHDLSVPEHDPLEISTPGELRSQLRDQISRSSVVLVLSGLYVSHSQTIQMELELADEFEKPIIGIRPWGNEKVPVPVQEYADEIVGWNTSSIVSAIAEHA